MIRFAQVSKRYESGHDALKNVSFHLDKQEMVFLIGRSGAGKSTLLKLITRVESATRGQLIVNERNITRLTRRQVPYLRREIGVVFQDHKLLHDRTVFDNVALPLVVAGVGHRETSRRVRAALDKVDLLGKERLYPIMLSGGEQQRVGIARAVVNRPPILLADEPTGNLDPELSDEIMDIFHQFYQFGVTVLIATHEHRHIDRLNKRVLELEQGRLVRGGDEQAEP
ncbi:MAG: cell division ATP-binding protein FtsE [Arenicellales bacterium]|nr:cell division ATP-binding protein FtsE [Arenicellales bacterium]